jgi:hypothetical protein
VRATAILARWQGGWRWVDDDEAPLRIEIQQGHSGDDAEMLLKVTAELATYGSGQTQITVGIDPETGDPVPGLDYNAGDRATVDGGTRDIEAMACQVDDVTGRVVAVPEFGTILDEPAERISRSIRGIGGLNGGTSKLSRPVASIPPAGVRPIQ